jgi:hypothetical protein
VKWHFPPHPPRKIPIAKSECSAKTYKGVMHVNKESLISVRMHILTIDGEAMFALETAAFHYFESNSTSNAAYGGCGGVSPPLPFPPVGVYRPGR